MFLNLHSVHQVFHYDDFNYCFGFIIHSCAIHFSNKTCIWDIQAFIIFLVLFVLTAKGEYDDLSTEPAQLAQ